MSKTIYTTVYGTKIYPIEYLAKEDLSDNDLNNLLDNNKLGLKYSLIIGMFRFINSTKKNFQIIKLIKTDKWNNNIYWTSEQFNEYEKLVIDVYKNIYQYKGQQALSLAQWFMTIYGLCIKGNSIDL